MVMDIGTISASESEQWLKNGYDVESIPRRELLLKTLESFDPFDSVLDIGCGDGPDLALIQLRYPGVEVMGLEENANKVEDGNRKFGKKIIINHNVCITQHDKIFKDNSFDIVISNAAIMYIPWPGAVLKEMYRIAKKGIIMIEQESDYLRRALKDYTIEKEPIECMENADWKTKGYLITIRK